MQEEQVERVHVPFVVQSDNGSYGYWGSGMTEQEARANWKRQGGSGAHVLFHVDPYWLDVHVDPMWGSLRAYASDDRPQADRPPMVQKAERIVGRRREALPLQ